MEATSASHPRPLLARERWIDLGGLWGFAHDDEAIGIRDGWQHREGMFTRQIRVPFPPESPASGIADSGFHPIVWYRRAFTLASEDRGKRIVLHCGAIDYRSSIWLNGYHACDHEGGQTPIEVDLTPLLHENGEQVLVIRAEDQPGDRAQPRGKQDWELRPHAIWYERTTGIWQPIWLEPVGEVSIADVRWTPDPEHAMLGAGVTVSGTMHRPMEVRIRLEIGGVLLSDEHYPITDGMLDARIAIACAGASWEQLLWTPDSPNLIDATVAVLDGEQQVDEVRSYVGFRGVGIDGNSFLLNGEPYYLRFVLEQGYWPETHLAAPSDEALRREVELVKELGFNGVRIHQKVENPRFLYWCDRLGLLVWGEMANAYVYSPASRDRLTREWIEVVQRSYSHPCIVAWVPVNESWGVPDLVHDPAQREFVRALFHLTRAIDPTRPVIGNDGWEYICGDILGIHDYTFDGDEIRQRYGSVEAIEHTVQEVRPGPQAISLATIDSASLPVMLTEFGGISYRPEPGTPWYGYGTVSSKHEYEAKYRELLDAVLDCPDVAGFCYTQLTDTGQETNGLLTANREPKLDPSFLRAITNRSSMAVGEH